MKLSKLAEKIRNDKSLRLRPIKVRFIAISFFFLIAIVSLPAVGLKSTLLPIFLALAIAFCSNFLSLVWIAWGKGLAYRVYFATFIDFLLITLVIHYLGGIETAASWVYAVALIAIASIYGLRIGIYAAVLSSAMDSGLLLGEYAGIIPHISHNALFNAVHLHHDKFYLSTKLLSDNVLFITAALISGTLSERLIRSKKDVERRNKEIMKMQELLQEHMANLEKTVAERTTELTASNAQLQKEIAERTQIEQELRESEERYRLHFEQVSDCIYSLDSNFYVTSVSPSVENLLGYKPEEILGKFFPELNVLAPEYFEAAASDISRVLAGERIISTEYEFITKDGKRRLGSVSGAPLCKDGKVLAVVSVARDITEQKQLERQLLQAQRMESIGTLAGGVAHDFNNLLGGILGYASFVKTKITRDDHIYNYIDTIERSAVRAAELTGQLLAFARGGKYETKVLNLNNIIEEALVIIARTFDKSIEIEKHLCEPLPTVEVDSAQIEQVIMNLCVNARDAMPDGGRLIIETHTASLTEDYARTHVGAKPGAYVTLSITDTGIGMDKETRQRIFEPFFTTKKEGKGTGLGLAMVYGVVKNHGGYVSVYSEVGEGSTFKIYLPANGKAETRDVVKTATPKGSDELVLIVDDEESIRSLLIDILESNGYRTLSAENGEEAVKLYERHKNRISLVILDMVMPKMGGRETFFKLKEFNPGVKALLSTGYSQNGKAKEILASGVMGFLQKPYQVSALLSKVRSLLDSRVA